MKISESMIQMTSGRSSEELDMVEKERAYIQRGARRSGFSGGWSGGGGSTAWVDRVSISSNRDHESLSEYSGQMVSKSEVWNSETGDHDSFEQVSVVERIVGAVMDHDVTIRSLGNGSRISSGDWINPPGPRVAAGAGESLVSIRESRVHFEQEQLGVTSQGQVKTEDGRTIEFSLDLAMERTQLSKTSEETLIRRWQEQANLIDPLVISLDGKVPQLTDTRFEFDLDNDGTTEEISFVSKGSGFLAFDKNQDGKINNGSELFGPGTGNGFQELAQYDSDGNHWIDENDEIFSKLSVWTRDDQGNDKLVSLKEAGLGAIYLDAAQGEFSIKGPDNDLKGQVKQSGVFLFEDGNVGAIQQIDLAAREPAPVLQAGSPLSMGPGMTSPLEIWPPLQPAPIGPVPQDDPPSPDNPFKALMDELKSLREQLQDAMENKSGRGRGTRAISDFQLYELTHLDLGAQMEARQLNRSLQGWG